MGILYVCVQMWEFNWTADTGLGDKCEIFFLQLYSRSVSWSYYNRIIIIIIVVRFYLLHSLILLTL